MIEDEGWPYEVSNFGQVRRIDSKRILKQRLVAGYLITGMSRQGKLKFALTHRLVAKAFIPGDDYSLDVNHHDCDKQNNKADNLEWVTRSENLQHASSNGLLNVPHPNWQGEKNTSHKLREAEVLEIRSLKGIFGSKKLARRYNVGRTTIRDIHQGKTWKHLLAAPIPHRYNMETFPTIRAEDK